MQTGRKREREKGKAKTEGEREILSSVAQSDQLFGIPDLTRTRTDGETAHTHARIHAWACHVVVLNGEPSEVLNLDRKLMALPNLGSFSSPTAVNVSSSSEDASKKVRKPYTITKSRESWTEPEHDKFLEALQLFDRDWKKIEAFIGSKTVIQIRSHAQKYFLKVQKSGTNEHLPPPRPKRKASHPYPQKAPKIAPVVSQQILSFKAPPTVPDPVVVRKPDSSALLGHPDIASLPDAVTSFSHATRGNIRSACHSLPISYSQSSKEATPRTRSTVLPDFAQVYGFIGSVFDPNATGHLQELKKMDPIDIETVLLLMRNLSINLVSPDFEDQRQVLSSCEMDPLKASAYDDIDPTDRSQS